MDFTLTKYRELLSALQTTGYRLLPYNAFLRNTSEEKIAVLRHDVDTKAHALEMARQEAEMHIQATYYFRAMPCSWDESLIREIAKLGHEIGYHYESMATCKGDVDSAYSDFCHHLDELRKIAPVETICMHGSPYSPHNNLDLWKKYDYKSLDVLGEPYLDTDFTRVFYLTDTGRCWNGGRYSVRDKINSQQQQWTHKGLRFHHTSDIIKALQCQALPSQLLFTVHPQRWTNSYFGWLHQLVWQSTKNQVKRIIVTTTSR